MGVIMKEPNCRSIVPSKNLWEIAIEFMGKIDTKLMEFNLKFAYLVYKFCKIEGIPNRFTKKLVFLACFNDVGKLYNSENAASTLIETYLFLKYFSPLKNFSEILLVQNKKFKLSISYSDGNRWYLIKKFTENLFKLNSQEEAYSKLLEDKDQFNHLDLVALGKIVKKTDIFYEINSMHYKTVIFKYISKMIFSTREKNEFFTMLSSLFEMYSAQTLYHSKVTAIIAYKIAKYMKLKNNRCKKIYVAGLAHDLGKVCIPLKILEKPDKLTDSEYSRMKKHVEFTKEILKNKMDYDVIEIAYRHHERIDGSGYPNKIDGEHLTIDQKILQVADVISALVAKRSYKEAWSIEKTIAILDENVNNNKLSMEVVECFKINKDKILKASNNLMKQADKIYDKLNTEREMLVQ